MNLLQFVLKVFSDHVACTTSRYIAVYRCFQCICVWIFLPNRLIFWDMKCRYELEFRFWNFLNLELFRTFFKFRTCFEFRTAFEFRTFSLCSKMHINGYKNYQTAKPWSPSEYHVTLVMGGFKGALKWALSVSDSRCKLFQSGF